uniref:Ankyrin repeat-containing protein n=1 Tax=Borely moumouvirus TaxID=2712067 RepID=A0A6G6ACH3_9VIRU
MTHLMLACKMSENDSHEVLVYSLLDKYADPFLTNNAGETALYLAQKGNNKNICSVITFYQNVFYKGDEKNPKEFFMHNYVDKKDI